MDRPLRHGELDLDLPGFAISSVPGYGRCTAPAFSICLRPRRRHVFDFDVTVDLSEHGWLGTK